ncbi:MAG: hypothetical protein U5R31_08905 [Acidimicrobiia bacterium]|nr:hypothetical protein [Acidimicrobiia bacterium]
MLAVAVVYRYLRGCADRGAQRPPRSEAFSSAAHPQTRGLGGLIATNLLAQGFIRHRSWTRVGGAPAGLLGLHPFAALVAPVHVRLVALR